MKKGNILLLVTLFFLSCNMNCTDSGDFFTGNGNIKTETRDIADFSDLKSAGSIDVEIIAGNKFELKVEDDENILSHLITEVKNGELNIYYDSNFSFGESHGKVIVEVPSLHKISSSGSGDIKIDGTLKSAKEILFSLSGSGDVEGNLDAPEIRVNIAGSGDINLDGKTQNFDCTTVGSGDVKCRNLKSEKVKVNLAGSSDVAVYASVSLKVDVTGSGDVLYAGNPSSPEINILGSGTVSKVN